MWKVDSVFYGELMQLLSRVGFEGSMNTATFQVFQTVLAFALVVLLCMLLKRLSIVKQEDGPVFAGLLTQAALPLVIFTKLATHPIEKSLWLAVLSIFLAGVICLGVAWVAGRLMKLDRPKLGALIMVSSFGSSALIGYPLVQYAFPNNPQAMQDAILISEVGVGLPIFILGVAVAMHFGGGDNHVSFGRKTILGYLRSPIFIAVVTGLLVSQLHIDPKQPFLAPFLEAVDMIAGSITVLACLILGLQLNFRSPRGLLPLVVVAVVIEMFLLPYLVSLGATLFQLPELQRQVLILEAAMPSAILNSVFATRYECDGETTSALVFILVLLSTLTLPAVFAMLGS